ncbi:metal-sulfur cluster assembly factor [Paracoccus marinaquae]|uniref:Metal-sulfur cluster assembly factor n=1 Tax=Paracoccus marinaquae TaxID=2841926 RepID=A0ABS6AMD2_9RHOB|nr:metal-sulfur cluster assembly factor [Paracoccus marinaquae]MBU3030591.1 metal-sulfur cluster assembly factor [Paracoccus marinaquae]
MNTAGSALRQPVEAALATIIDPETGYDLIAMGLIRAIRIEDGRVHVSMTTTVQGCPMTEALRLGAEAALASVPGVSEAKVDMGWDPPWTPDRVGRGVWS